MSKITIWQIPIEGSYKRKPIEYYVNKRGCWICLSHSAGKSRNRLWIKGKLTLVYRYVYELFKKKIPKKLLCCHICDNGYCINPNHIFLGTHKDNMMDMSQKGRTRQQLKTHVKELRKIIIEETKTFIEDNAILVPNPFKMKKNQFYYHHGFLDIEIEETKEMIRRAMNDLYKNNIKLHFIIEKMFWQNKTLEEVGIILNCSRENVRQLKNVALKFIETKLKSSSSISARF